MDNRNFNLDVIHKVAHALGELNEHVAYVGGAVVSLYVDDPAAEDVRPTKDVDITLEIASLPELEELREKLTTKGFTQSADDKVICRFRYDDITVDVMSTQAVGWAPSDEWFQAGFAHLEEITIKDIKIRILPLPYFLAAKFNAFHDRGGNDARTSHDFEDITYLLDNRTDLVEQIENSPDDVKAFLKGEFKNILNSSNLKEAILGNLSQLTQTERFDLIMEKLKKILD